MTKALVVLSGGQDSTTCLFWALYTFGKGNVHAISFSYGQRHTIELESARRVAALAGVPWTMLSVGHLFGTSPLTDPNATLDTYANFDAMAAEVGDRVEKTFVPLRNALFIVHAANYAITHGIQNVILGVCQQDNANYPDCRKQFIEAAEDMLDEALGVGMTSGTPYGVKLLTPLMYLSKAETIRLALDTPGAYTALAWSHTSYDGKFPPVGMNHSNLLRAQGFLEAGVPDPLVMRAVLENLMDIPETENYQTKAIVDVLVRLDPDGHIDLSARVEELFVPKLPAGVE